MAEIVKNLSEGSITLPSVTVPSDTTNKLYNDGGTVKFGTTILGGGDYLSDLDADTTIELEAAADEDIIRFNTGDTPAGFPANTNTMTIASSGFVLALPTANVATTVGAPISLTAGAGNTTGAGGAVTIVGGQGGAAGVGGDVTVTSSAVSPSGSSGSVTLAAANANALVNSLIAGQDETNYTLDFNGGTGHAVSDVITLADGSTVTVDAESAGVVTQFTVTTSGGVTVQIQPHPTNLTQTSSTGSGTGFFLQPQGDNVVQDAQTGGDVTISAGDGGTSTTGGGDVTITSGRQRGTILIKSGDARTTGNGAYGGKIDIEVGTSFQNSGEKLSITGGDSDYEGGDAFGGDVRIAGGNAFGTGGDPANSYGGNVIIEGAGAQYSTGADPEEGGDVRILGGSATYVGGDVEITAGSQSINDSYSGLGGNVNITAGYSSSYYGGDVNITSGDANAATGGIGGVINISTPDCGYGANINITTGNGTYLTGDGGDINLTAGNSTLGHGGDIELQPGTGNSGADDGAIIIGTSSAPSVTTNKLYNVAGALTWNGTDLTAGGGIAAVVDDTTPQLGGQLDVNGNAIGDGTLELITFTETGSAVNQINIANAATAGAPVISAAGGDANIDISIQPKGTGNVVAGNFTFDGDQTVGAGQDNFVLTYDNGSGLIALEAAAGGGNSLSVTTVTTTTATAAAWDAVMVDDDTAGSTVTITLPAGSTDDQIVVKKLGTTANVIIDGDSAETIDGAATFTLTAQYASVSLIWNGTEWSII